VRAAIQPRRRGGDREAPLVSEAGVTLSDHVIYMRPTDITTADAIEHDASVCPVLNDLPTCRFEIVGVPNAAGLGHHLEIDAKLVATPELAGVTS
jgi:hypothetical protein